MKKTITLLALMLITSISFAQDKKADTATSKHAIQPYNGAPIPPPKKMYFFAFDEDFVAGIYKIIMSSNEPFASVVMPVKQMFEYQFTHQPDKIVTDTVQKKP